MNKLGFVIHVVSDGAYNALECNKGTWAKKVIDPRHYLRIFSGLVGTKNIVTAISFSEFGCYIMMLRDIPGHAGDCLSGWIFIPNSINITDDEVMGAYCFAKNLLNQTSIENIRAEAESFFSKIYIEKKNVIPYSPSVGDKLGLRYVNSEGELLELLGKKRYQEYYSQFKAIFILDRNSEVEVNAEGASYFSGDLTKQPLEEYCVLVSPTDRELSEMGQGTKVIFRNGRTFESPISVKKGSRVELFARRNGFEDIAFKTFTIDDDVMTFPYAGHLDWKKIIRKTVFDIRNYEGKKVEAEKIIVAGYDVMQQQVSLPEEECRHAKVTVSAFKYEPWKSTEDLWSLQGNLKVTLHRAEEKVDYTIVLANGQKAEMTLKSKYFDGLSESPLEGYSSDGRTLYASLGYKLKYWLYGILTAVGIFVIIAGYASFDSYMDNHEFQFGWPPIVEKKVAPPSEDDEADMEPSDTVEAIAYLNEHEKWSKAAMDTLSALPTGLYDCLKQYRFEDLVNMSVDSCEQFNKIKEIAKKAMENGVEMPNVYDDSPDSTITVKKWMQKVQAIIDNLQKKDDITDVIDQPTTVAQPKEDGELVKKVNENKQKKANKANSVKNNKRSAKDNAKPLPKSDPQKPSIPDQKKM